MAGTSFFTFTAGTPARASEVDSDFDWLQRDIVPQLNGNLTTGAYDLGTTTAEWRRLYVQNINPTTTASPLVVGTTTSANASSTVFEIAGQRAFTIPRMTTVQRDLLTGVNGMLIYNSTPNQFQFFQNGVWANMIGSAIGLVAKTTTSHFTNAATNVMTFAGSGRLLGIYNILGATTPSDLRVHLGIDSVTTTLNFLSGTSAGDSHGFLVLDKRNTTATFNLGAAQTTGTFGITIPSLDIYFRTALDISHNVNPAANFATVTTFVLFERSA